MPVMVIYTANASGGSALADLQDAQKLRNHFGNFITQCLAAQSYKDETHPVPATFVLNPDFLGALQQEPYGYTVVRQKKQCAGECPTGGGDTSITGDGWLYRAFVADV